MLPNHDEAAHRAAVTGRKQTQRNVNGRAIELLISLLYALLNGWCAKYLSSHNDNA